MPPSAVLTLIAMSSPVKIPSIQVKKLLSQAGGSGWRPVDALAAAITHLKYDGSFAVVPSEIARFEESIQRETIPAEMATMLGEDIDARSFKGRSVNARSMLSLAVLHRCADEFATTLARVLQDAVELSTNPSIDLRWSTTEGPPARMRTHIGDRPVSGGLVNEMTKRAYAETGVLHKQERDRKDPAKNGKPEAALEVPRPELADSFSWWCLRLGYMLASPHVDKPRYAEVIDKMGEHCIRLMPKAQVQARAKKMGPHSTEDRYGSVENESLPKYARWLLKRGLADRARLICEMALQHGILPKSPGAFERGLAAAGKKSRPKS